MKRLFILLTAFFCIVSAHAAYLRNVPMTLTQPDGSVLHCYASGDEYFNFLHDSNGYTIIQHPETGYYVYAEKRDGKLVATNFIAGVYDPASKGLEPYTLISPEEWMARRQARQMPDKRPQNRDANHGTLNNLSIFIRFADDPEFTNSYSSIDNMFNDVSENAVSMRSYFRAASYGAIEIPTTFYPEHNGDAIISYQDIYPRSYYRPYNSATNPDGYNNDNESREREFSLLERAVNYVNDNYPVPSDLNIDYDDDGNVDNVCFIVKGNVDSWSSLIWPHQWFIFDRTVNINGKRVYTFNFQLADANDYFNTSVMCHEMNHSLGAPDLYHYDYGQFIMPVGPWDLMDRNATPPQHCGAYMKMKYGHWIDEIPEITQTGIYTLNPISSATPTNIAYKIQSSDPNQYYVLEYRDNTSLFETSLPGSGLLVYRIDTRFDGNANYNPYMDYYDEIYLFRPGGTTSANGNINAAFFSADVGRTEFNASTNPHPFLSNGTIDNELKIYNITSAGNTISFSYGSGCEPPTHLVASVEGNNVTLSWDAVTNAVSYNIFRDGTLVGNTSETMYLDSEVASGFYTYNLRSINAYGIPSDPSETVIVSVMVEDGIIVGDGGLATNSFLPSNSYYNYSLTQQIYTADEIGEAGVITGMAFYLDGTQKTRTFDIYMKSTTKSAFSSAADWETVSNTNKVFSGSVTLAANAWTLITFDIPYIHDGTSNIVLVTDDNTGSYSSTMSCRVFDAPNQAISAFSDDQNYDPTAPQTSYYEDADMFSVKNQIILTKEAIPTDSYNITVSVSPTEAGTVSGGGAYGFGEICTVIATPIDGYSFVNWTQNGEVVSTETPYSFIVFNDMELVANFSESLYVTVSVNPAEAGTVSGAGAYGNGSTCTLIATPAEGYFFLSWTQDGEVISTDATYSFTVESDTELVANFSEGLLIGDGGSASDENLPSSNYYCHSLSQQIYTADELGSAGLITSIAFYNEGAEKTRIYDFYMKATEKSSFSDYGDWETVFAGDKVFSGSVTFATDVWTVLTLTAPFYYDGTSNIVLVADDNSNAYTDDPNMECRVFDANSQAIFVHSDGTDYDPSHPTYFGSVLSVKNQIIITKEAPPTEPVNITVSASPAQGGMVTGGGVYNFGETCTVTATVNVGYNFIGWIENGELVTNNLEFSFSAVRDRDLVATFSEGIYIGDGGAETNMTLPNYSGFKYSLSQQIYTADEIGTAGSINSIAFYNEGMQKTRSYDMYLVHTDKNAFESTGDWIAVTEADKVFSGSVIMVSGDWTYITFDTPFEYDGMSNLVLVMDDNTSADNFGISCRVFDTEDTQAIRVYSNNVNYNPMEPPTNCTSGDHPGLLSDKNQIILGITVSKTFTKEIIGYGEGDGHYYLIASPIGEVSPTEVTNMLNTTNGYDLYYFDHTQDMEWINYKAGSFNLEAGKGYLYANNENVVLSFIGSQYNGTGEVTLSKASGAEFEGWNLVGNPFSKNAYIDRDFYTMNEDGTEIIPASDIERNYIEPMEGVFVVTEQDQEALTFSTTAPNNKGSMIVLDLTQGHGTLDRAIVRFGLNRMLPKFQINKNSSKIYIPMDNFDYAVVHADNNMGEMPVNFKAEKNGTYSISVSYDNIGVSYLHLIDNMTGADVDLLQTSSYSFEAKTTDYASRFKLVFSVNSEDGPSTGSETFAFVSDGNIIITDGPSTGSGTCTLQVVDVTGRIVVQGDAINRISTSGMTAGVYVLRLINGDDMKMQKIVVR